MQFLKDKGKSLIAGGFEIVPIKNGGKHPGMKGWESLQATATDVDAWTSNGRANDGVGVLSKHTPGVDIDILDEAISLQMGNFTRELLGDAPVRIGKFPKRLLIYKTTTPFKKVKSPVFIDPQGNDAAVEVLGDGQQYVVFHIHPDTNKPYYYEGDELDSTWELEDINHDDAVQICAEFERVADNLGWKRKAGAKLKQEAQGHKKKVDLSWDRIREMLWAITEKAEDHDTWVQIGMAIHYQSEGKPLGLKLWDEWSQFADNYEKGECAKRWPSFNINQAHKERNPVTCATIIKYFKDSGGDASKIDEVVQFIRACEDRKILLKEGVKNIVSASLSTEDSEYAAQEIKVQHKKITGTGVSIQVLRALLKKEVLVFKNRSAPEIQSLHLALDPSKFPHCIFTESGNTILKSTHQNLEFILKKYGISLYYDVLLKRQEIVMPNGVVEFRDFANNSKVQHLRSLLALRSCLVKL